MTGKRKVIEAGMKRIRRWHGRWLLIAAVLGLSVGGSGQWADRRQQSFPPAIALPNGPSPGGSVALGSMEWAGDGRANRAEPEAGLWPEAGADGQYRVIDASRYDRQLQREHELVLCQGHRVLWRFGEQLREEALDSIRWSAAGGVVGRAVGTAVKTARQAVRHGHAAAKKADDLFATTMRQVEALDFSTAANRAVFYSGPGNRARALSFAERTGATPIDLTPGGRYLSSLNLYETLPAAQADAIWARASQAYTARASGQIHLFIRGARPDRMFNTMERPLIKENQHLQTDLPLLNMFTRLGPNSAQSSEGFRVERTGRMELKYTEADRNLVVEVEPGEGLAIYRSSISGWNPPNESEALTDDDRQRIVRNICAALDFLQVPYVLA
ncbi:MAG TPA: Imm74 family immunity protein [Candidatus Paceibacterota bacterium]|nr:Imm74 family immunity protein [Candidatus Paceibacterota bacterium]